MGWLNGQNLVLGIVEGGIYGLLAVGIVLVYRGSRVLNFAQGELGTLGLFAAWWLTTEHGLPWVVGAAGAILTATAIGLLFERLIVRKMVDASRISVAVATVGLLLFLLSFGFRVFGESPRTVRPPISGHVITLAGVVVSPTQILSIGVTLAVALGLAALLKKTDFGLGVLAAGWKTNVSPGCPIDFSGSVHDGSGSLFDVMETYRSPSGRVNWRSTSRCQRHPK